MSIPFWPVAGALAGVIIGVLEVAVGSRHHGLVPLLSLLPRLAVAGAVLGLLAALGEVLARAAGRRRAPWLRLGWWVMLLAAAAWLFAEGHFRRDAGTEAAAAWFLIGGTGVLWASVVLLGRLPTALRLLVAFLLLAAGTGAMFLNPGGYRGTYPILDVLGLGIALGAVSAAAWPAVMRRRGLATVAALAIVASMAFVRTPPTNLTTLQTTAGRLAIVETMLRDVGIAIAPTLDHAFTATTAAELLDPPAHLTRDEARRRFRDLRKGKRPLNVLWVTMDAVRADVTGALGGTCTPELDALGARGHVFTNAFSQAPGTGPSVESFTTGRYTSRTAIAYGWRTGGEEPIRFPTIAALATEQGLRTGFITGLNAATLDDYKFVRLKRGFQDVVVSPDEPDALRTASQARDWIAARKDERWFAWAHFFDPHAPYVPRLGTPRDSSPRALWESEVRYSDMALGQLVRALEELGLHEDTAIVVHADHAEAFNEHGRYWHNTDYFDNQIHTPLVFFVPGLEPAVHARPAGNVDIFPTLVDLLDIPGPDHLQGHSLVGLFLDPTLEYPRFALSETYIVEDDGRWREDRIQAITDGRWKLIEHRSAHAQLLFDRQEDPGEKRNLVASHSEELRRLRGYLQALTEKFDADDERFVRQIEVTGLDDIRARLQSDVEATRHGVLQELIARRPMDTFVDLAGNLTTLRPDAAHALLVMWEHFLSADLPRPHTEVPLPDRATPLRYRLLERFARWPSYWDAPLPSPVPPVSPAEQWVLDLARAARGDPAMLDRIKPAEPASVRAWHNLIPILARGGDPTAGRLLETSPMDADKEATLLRCFHALALGDRVGFTANVVNVWPAEGRRVVPQTLAELARLAIEGASQVDWPALLALHGATGASTTDRDNLARALQRISPGWSQEDIEAAARSWTEARFEGRTPRALAALERVISLVPKDLPLRVLQGELAWLRATVAGTVPDGIEVAALDLASRPPTITLRSRHAGPLAIGPGVAGNLTLRWTLDDARVGAAALSLPRCVLAGQGETLTFPVALDYPTEGGPWTLQAEFMGQPLAFATEPPRHTAPSPRHLVGPELGQVANTWILPGRTLPKGLLLETIRDGHSGILLTPVDLDAGSVRIRIALSAWYDGPGPFCPELFIEGRAAIPFEGALPFGERQELVLTLSVEKPGPYRIGIRWPSPAALIFLESIEVL